MSALYPPTPPREVTRRSFMKHGLLGGALLAVGSATVIAKRNGKAAPAPTQPLRYIEPAIFPVLVAVIERVLPPGDPHVMAVAMHVDEGLHFAQANTKDFNGALGLLENGLAGLLTRGSTTPFTLLSPEQQDTALMRWRDSRIAILTGAYNGMRKMILGAYYGDGARAAAVGYPGPVFEKPDPGVLHARARISPPYVPRVKEPHE